jgi:hypothetical protein
MLAFGTPHENWLPSLIFSSFGRDKSDGAGSGSPFPQPAKSWPLDVISS